MGSTVADDREFRDRGGIADLSARVKLRLTGADRVRFLNGQVTSNVQKLAPGEAQRACVTTAKGKLCAEVMISAEADGLLVDADASLAETLAARLERYIISDDVTIADESAELRLIHLFGVDEISRRDELDRVFGQAGSRPFAMPQRANRFGMWGLDLFLTPTEFDALWPPLAVRFSVADETLCESLRIERGVPRWGRELDENTLPPEAGLDRTHIDFHKGCYIGQEVISRLRSVGHVNRQLTGFAAESGAPLAAGASLFAPGDDSRAVGTITSAAFSFALEKSIALGYLRRGAPTRGLLARAADLPTAETVVSACDLPFST